MALVPYPKLKAALFPSGPRGPSPSSDITVYHLLQVWSQQGDNSVPHRPQQSLHPPTVKTFPYVFTFAL